MDRGPDLLALAAITAGIVLLVPAAWIAPRPSPPKEYPLMNARRLTRIGWYAAGASLACTVGLLAYSGFRLNVFMFWFLLIGFTATGTGRFYVWWKFRKSEEFLAQNAAEESAAAPIDWGVGSQLPDGGVRLVPISFGHPVDCTHCKLQAANIPVA